MIKLFFIIFFIAELIIAFSIISKLYKFDKKVLKLNNEIEKNKEKIQTLLVDFRLLLKISNKSLVRLREIIIQKKQEYLLQTLKNLLIYGSFFFLKGKYKKTIFAYQILKETYEGFIEAYP